VPNAESAESAAKERSSGSKGRGLLAGFTGSVVLMAMAGAVALAVYLWPRLPLEFEAGQVAGYALGEIRHFRPTKWGYERVEAVEEGRAPMCLQAKPGFFVVRRTDGFVAFTDRNSYWRRTIVFEQLARAESGTGIRVYWTGGGHIFRDSCQDGSYTLDDAQVVRGPGWRPLDTHAVRVERDRVYVSLAGVRHREPGQKAIATPA
jgi:hypothetical protein